MKIINVEATTLPDSWFQLVYNALEHGRHFKIDEGSFAGHGRLEMDFVVANITRPFERDVDGLPLLPEMPEGNDTPPPVDRDNFVSYIPYIMGGLMGATPEENESYTYGQRMTEEIIDDRILDEYEDKKIYKDIKEDSFWLNEPHFDYILNQIELICKTYKENGHRNNQLVIQIAKPTDLLLLDPPCLRQIDTRIQDGKLHFFPYFRSWDLWSGYPANLAGISILQEYMAEEIGVEQGEMVATSKGLHLYDYSLPFAEMRTCVSTQPHREDKIYD